MLNLEIPIQGLRLKSKSKFCGLKLKFDSKSINILIGPNGGGKTTLLRSILSPKEAGINLILDDQNLNALSPFQRSRLVSYLGTSLGDRPNIRVEDFLSFSFFKRGDVIAGKERIKNILQQLEIENLINTSLDQLSEGEYRRVHLASCLLQEASWYVLDEPEEHLDPRALQNLANIISSMKSQGKSFIMACHNLSFASFLADRFIGISLTSGVVFNKCKDELIGSKCLEDLFLCEFIYSSTNSDLHPRPLILGPKYE